MHTNGVNGDRQDGKREYEQDSLARLTRKLEI